MNILLAFGVALLFFVIIYMFIKPAKKKMGKKNHYVCDVCKGDICECRPAEEGD